MKTYIEAKEIFCPLCKCGLGTIEIDCRTLKGIYPQKLDCHCTKCDIWFMIREVTNAEKLEMFRWQ